MSKTKEQIELEYVEYFQRELGIAIDKSEDLVKDITIICEGVEFTVHSSVLKIGSPYFKDMLDRLNVKECDGRIEADNVDAVGMDAAIIFLYWGKIEADEDNLDQLKSVLNASEVLEIKLLNSYCWQVLAGKLNDQYFVELWKLGEKYNNPGFLQNIRRFVAFNFARAAKSDDFGRLSAHQLEQLLRHSGLTATTDTIVMSLLTWAKESAPERCDDLLRFLALQDLNEMTNSTLGQTLQSDLVAKSRPVFDIFRPEVTARLRRVKDQRFFSGHNLVCFRKLQTEIKNESFFSVYNIQKETWTSAKRLPIDLDQDAVIVARQDCVFIIYRSSAECDVMMIQTFSPAHNAIIDSGYLKQVLYRPGAFALKDKLYILGGATNAELSNPSLHAYSYEFKSRRCAEVAVLPEACVDPVIQKVENYLFAVGRSENKPSVLLQYNLSANQWTKLRVLPERVTRGVVWGQKLYLILETQTRFEVFDHNIDLWFTEEIKNGPSSVTGLWNLGKVGKQEARLLFRGEDFSLRCYNVKSGKWDPCRQSVLADDQCLSVHDVELQLLE